MRNANGQGDDGAENASTTNERSMQETRVSASFQAESKAGDIYFYPRGGGERVRETVMAEGVIKWAYQSKDVRGIRALAFKLALPSRVLGWYFASRLSHGRIRKAIDNLAIDEREFRDPTSSFRSFHDFFTRHLKPEARPWDADPQVMVHPADGRVLVYPRLHVADVVPVKGVAYSVDSLLGRRAPEFYDGTAMVVRLCPADYHRFHFPCDGQVIETRDIPGVYHSVNPIPLALGLNVFCENKRSYTIIDSPVFGKIAYVEVGAFGVGSIVQTWIDATRQGKPANHPGRAPNGVGESVEKMQEKGYFTFGGSTLVLLFQKNRLRLDDALVAHSAEGWETLVHVGDSLGVAAT